MHWDYGTSGYAISPNFNNMTNDHGHLGSVEYVGFFSICAIYML